MTQQPPKKKAKKPLGDPVDWTDQDLNALSTISEADLKAANALWQNEAPPKLKNLLNAKVQEEGQDNGK